MSGSIEHIYNSPIYNTCTRLFQKKLSKHTLQQIKTKQGKFIPPRTINFSNGWKWFDNCVERDEKKWTEMANKMRNIIKQVLCKCVKNNNILLIY